MYIVKMVCGEDSMPVYECAEMTDAVMYVSAMAKYAKKFNGTLVIVENL